MKNTEKVIVTRDMNGCVTLWDEDAEIIYNMDRYEWDGVGLKKGSNVNNEYIGGKLYGLRKGCKMTLLITKSYEVIK